MEKIWNKLQQGLREYCKQNGFAKVILGLSGGMDSALVSVLAADALGAENVCALMMKTKYTSEQSLEIAAELAQLNGFAYQVLDIQDVIVAQKQFLRQAMGEEPKQIVIENLQARERGKVLMAFSNQYGYLLLACGNKSEAAMGYCTLYGDVCGGLSPIGGLYKSEIFEIARWRNQQGYVIPEAVINRAPTAELGENQKDEDSLPPYAVLDQVLEMYLEQGKNLDQIVKAGFDSQVVEWVIRQYHKMAYKREQMPRILPIA